jgi:hypothetical protein
MVDSNGEEIESNRQERLKDCIWVILQRSSEHGLAHIDGMKLNVQILEQGVHCHNAQPCWM